MNVTLPASEEVFVFEFPGIELLLPQPHEVAEEKIKVSVTRGRLVTVSPNIKDPVYRCASRIQSSCCYDFLRVRGSLSDGQVTETINVAPSFSRTSQHSGTRSPRDVFTATGRARPKIPIMPAGRTPPPLRQRRKIPW